MRIRTRLLSYLGLFMWALYAPGWAQDASAWESLGVGQSREQVVELLGRPQSKVDGVFTYPGGNHYPAAVVFGDEGKVVGWTKPEKLRRTDAQVKALPWSKLKVGMPSAEIYKLLGHPCYRARLVINYGPVRQRGGCYIMVKDEKVTEWVAP